MLDDGGAEELSASTKNVNNKREVEVNVHKVGNNFPWTWTKGHKSCSANTDASRCNCGHGQEFDSAKGAADEEHKADKKMKADVQAQHEAMNS